MRLSKEINRDRDCDSSQQTSHCIICNTRFKAPLKILKSQQQYENTDSNSKKSNVENQNSDLKLVNVLQEMCSIFSKYFNVKSSMLSAKTWDFSREIFPFCHKCRDTVTELSILHNELESVRRKINKLIARTSTTIISSFSLNGETSEITEGKDCHRKISRVRKSIYKQLNPGLILTDVKHKQRTSTLQVQNPTPLSNSNQNLKSNEEIQFTHTVIKNSPVSTADNNCNAESQLSNHFKGDETYTSQNQTEIPEKDNNSDPVSADDDNWERENDDCLIASDISEEEDFKIETNEEDKEIEKEESSNLTCENDSLPRQPSIMERLRSRMSRVTTAKTIELEPEKEHDDNDDDSLSSSSSSTSNSTDSEDDGKERIKLSEVIKLGYRKYSVRDHLFTKKVHNGKNKNYKCGHCDQPEKTKKLILSHILGWHIKSHQSSNTATLKENPMTKKYVYQEKYPFSLQDSKFKCGLCKISCTHKLTMIRHIHKTHFPEARNFECRGCFRVFTTEIGLKKHDCSKPGRFNHIATVKCGNGKFLYRGEFPYFKLVDGQGYKCGSSGCDYQSKNRLHTMQDHIRRIHADKMRFVCEKCGKNSCSPIEFKLHLATHSDQKDFQCDECGKRIKTLPLLRLHKKLHQDIYPFKCDAEGCGSKFKLKMSLEIHRNRLHPQAEEKATWKFKCPVCGELLKSERKLNIHKKEHQVKKSSECPECHKKFWGNTQLNIHLNRHKKVLKFFCKECNKGFLQKWQLTRHNQGKPHQERVLEVGGNNNNSTIDDNLTKSINSSQVSKKQKPKKKGADTETEEEESDTEEEEEEHEEEDEGTTTAESEAE